MIAKSDISIPDSVYQYVTVKNPKLSFSCSALYSPRYNMVHILLSKKYTGATYENINDKEIIEFFTSEINHEILHYVIQKYIDGVTSAKFDLIAKDIRVYQFRHIRAILKKLGYHFKTKKEVKREYGLKSNITQNLNKEW